MKTKNAFRRGFTLIELMIVIVILGILMGTILPRLTGAQSRARDTARIADLNNISQAMEVYFSDFGEYPTAACTSTVSGEFCGGGTANKSKCLDMRAAGGETPDAASTYTKIMTYLKGDRVPQNVGVKTDTLGCIGSYYYTQLKKGGTLGGSYVLASDLETWQMANYEAVDHAAGAGDGEFLAASEASKYIKKIGKLKTEPTGTTNKELQSIYIVIP